MPRVDLLYEDFQLEVANINESLENFRYKILDLVLLEEELQSRYIYRFIEPQTIEDVHVTEYDELYIDDIIAAINEKPKLIVNFKQRDKYEAFIISIEEFKEYVYGNETK